MSKIYTKTSREPYLVTRSVAEAIAKDYADVNILQDTKMTIKHLEGTKIVLKSDLRSFDISYNDRDYYDRKAEISPRPQNIPAVEEQTEEEKERSKQAMLKAKENLRKAGIIK